MKICFMYKHNICSVYRSDFLAQYLIFYVFSSMSSQISFIKKMDMTIDKILKINAEYVNVDPNFYNRMCFQVGFKNYTSLYLFCSQNSFL
jgi:hypothetical protein